MSWETRLLAAIMNKFLWVRVLPWLPQGHELGIALDAPEQCVAGTSAPTAGPRAGVSARASKG
eukprot:9205870-Ditylum_brightwellii.AAC.1